MAPLLLCTVSVLLAMQATAAMLAGTVRDADTGEPLRGAAVALIELGRVSSTDEAGRYVLRDVPVGSQTITVRFVGHAAQTIQAIVPSNGILEINVSLLPDPVELAPLEVRPWAAGAPADAEDQLGTPARRRKLAEIWTLPTVAEPDAFLAMSGGEVVLHPESPSGMHIRGGSTDHTAYFLDGIPVFSPYHTAGLVSAWNPDALDSIQWEPPGSSPTVSSSLAGAVEASTRAPGDRVRTRGGLTNTQARATLDGPLGGGAGFQLSLRSGLPAAFSPADEPSYVGGETGDWLGKLEVPTLGGTARILGYDSADEIHASARVTDPNESSFDPRRNLFEWHSRSWGAEWQRESTSLQVRTIVWSASSNAACHWHADSSLVRLAADRRDNGIVATVRRASGRTTAVAGARLERIATSYRVDDDSSPAPWDLGAHTSIATLFGRTSQSIGRAVSVEWGGSLAAFGREVYPDPHASVRWTWTRRASLTAGFARTHQYAQSLRNAESVVGNVFPVELFAGAGEHGVPVASSDQIDVGSEWSPSRGTRFNVRAFQRNVDGLLLVAPEESKPFATRDFAVGSGSSRGLLIDAQANFDRFRFAGSYGWQRVRLTGGGITYVPENGAVHQLEGGLAFLPTPFTSIRLGAVTAFGRRATALDGGFEWEAYNFADRGNEFAGSPDLSGDLGGAVLPAYARVDLGVRKSWSFGVRGRGGSFALFGSATNVLARRNVLTYSRDSVTSRPLAIEMRPQAPFVFGIDWQF